MNNKVKHVLLGAAFTAFFFLLLGIPTALVPNPLFKRMISVSFLDYLLLALTSLLAGAYISYSLYLRGKQEGKGDYAAFGGTLAGVFGFGCPICNVLLVSLFGSVALLAFFEPYRHLLSLLTIALFAIAFYLKIKGCKSCEKEKGS